MPIKLDAGDSFALDLELMLLVNSNGLCKCNGHHSWLEVQVCSRVRPSGGGAHWKSPAWREPGALHAPQAYFCTPRCLSAWLQLGWKVILLQQRRIFHREGPCCCRELSKGSNLAGL